MSRHLIDTNVLIESHNRYYNMEFCPAFWDWLIEANQEGRVASISDVADELLVQDDAISHWVSTNSTFFNKADDQVRDAVDQMSKQKYWGRYKREAVDQFFDSADFWLVCFALVHSFIVVTQEIFRLVIAAKQYH